MMVLLVQFSLSSSGYGSTGVGSTLTGGHLVKSRLPHDSTLTQSMGPTKKVYVIQQGDILFNILEKAGVSKKDALFISKRANSVYTLRKMRPGSELELYFTPDGTGLQEVDYKVSARKRVVLYNGRIVYLAPRAAITSSAQSLRYNSITSMESPRKNSLRPVVIPRDHRQGAKVPSKANHSAGLKSSPLDTSTSARAYPPDARSHTSKTPSSGIKLAASYSYDLPDCMKNTDKTPLELLASGVVFSSLKTPWEKDEEAAMVHSQSGNTHNLRGVSTKFHAPVKKNSPSLQKNTTTKTAYHRHTKKSSEDLFLKAPLKYSHVSSGFTYCRKNPISNSPRPHLGIDYAAPAGTPVHSIGPGRVIFHGWERGYGKTIRIRHRNGFMSQYAHLSRFARGIMTGKMVKRGETIGYVGMTGLATGPHLDFRVTYLGMYINPVNLGSRSKKLSSKNAPRKIRGSSRG